MNIIQVNENIRIIEDSNKFFIERRRPAHNFLWFWHRPETWTREFVDYGWEGHSLWEELSFDSLDKARNCVNQKFLS